MYELPGKTTHWGVLVTYAGASFVIMTYEEVFDDV